MSDGTPTLGPKIARPGAGMPRNDPGTTFDGAFQQTTGGFLSPGENRGFGIVVLPWNLIKPAAVRKSTIGAGYEINMELDAAWYTVL